MKISINCRSFINRKYTGIGRYTYHLVKSLVDIDSVNEYFLYAKKGFLNVSKRIPDFGASNFLFKID